MRHLGAFVSVAGGLEKAIENGSALGLNTIMIHPSPPQRWHTKPFPQESIDNYNSARKGSGIETVYFHGIYLTNLANPDKQKFHLGKLALRHYLDLAEAIDADGVVFHVGSFKDTTEDEGFKRIIKGIDWILKESENDKPLLLECAAGAGSVVGDQFEELARIFEGVSDKSRVFFCLDTQHMFASGYDLVGDLEGVVSEIERILGLDLVHAIHFNDSKTEFNSKRDRHENIGEGLIGKKAMQAFLNHPKLQKLPFIMETPALKDPDTARKEVDKLKSWAQS
ncbi:MAG: deoxyribonuclease IV [Candidatus Dojkabacteria bacterium]